jgi:ribosomal protein S18 acetylase RimI-like enzyme
MSFLDALDRPSPLDSQIEAQTRDLDWTLAHFTFVANVTTLAKECDIAHSPMMSVASCRSLPQFALAFMGHSADLLATYATFLTDPGSEVDLLVNDCQRAVVEKAFEVSDILPQWQMLFRGDPDDLSPERATQLADNDISALIALARAEAFPLRAYSQRPFTHGPAYGVWERRRLVAMGTTTLCVPGAAQIDNVLTHSDYRRQGYGSAVVAALIAAHRAEGRHVFAVVEQSNEAAIEFFESLEFVRARPMYRMHCVLHSVDSVSL